MELNKYFQLRSVSLDYYLDQNLSVILGEEQAHNINVFYIKYFHFSPYLSQSDCCCVWYHTLLCDLKLVLRPLPLLLLSLASLSLGIHLCDPSH